MRGKPLTDAQMGQSGLDKPIHLGYGRFMDGERAQIAPLLLLSDTQCTGSQSPSVPGSLDTRHDWQSSETPPSSSGIHTLFVRQIQAPSHRCSNCSWHQYIQLATEVYMLHSGKARCNRDQQRQSLVQMIKAQQMRTNTLTCAHDPAADPRHVEFMQRKHNQSIHWGKWRRVRLRRSSWRKSPGY